MLCEAADGDDSDSPRARESRTKEQTKTYRGFALAAQLPRRFSPAAAAARPGRARLSANRTPSPPLRRLCPFAPFALPPCPDASCAGGCVNWGPLHADGSPAVGGGTVERKTLRFRAYGWTTTLWVAGK